MAEHIIYKLGPFQVSDLGDPRFVRVYEPPRDREAGPPPVLYMFDGQNIFHDAPSFAGGWHLHETVCALAAEGLPAPVVVGVDHGGAARIDGLSPFRTDKSAGREDELLDWLVGEIVPRIAREFDVGRGPECTMIGGSSMGGLAALYAHFRHPDVFGGALCMSPSFWIGRGRIVEYLATRPRPAVSRIYIDAGGREDGGSVLAQAERVVAHLRERGYDDADLCFRPDPDGEHCERDWRRRAPDALRFLLQPREAGARDSLAA